MKYWIAFFFAVLNLNAQASTQAIFAADGSKATVLLMSMTSGDTDASRLYAALTTPEEVINGKPTKRMEFRNNEGARSFSVVCVMSAFAAGNGTCTVILYASSNSDIDKRQLTARMTIQDKTELRRILSEFSISPGNDLIFATTDGHFQVKILTRDTIVRALEINYR